MVDSDRLFFPFSFGPFIGFWGAFESATLLGNFCLPSGGMSTTARLRYLLDHRATVICCTPTYALRMAEVAASEGLDLRWRFTQNFAAWKNSLRRKCCRFKRWF